MGLRDAAFDVKVNVESGVLAKALSHRGGFQVEFEYSAEFATRGAVVLASDLEWSVLSPGVVVPL